MPKTAHKGSPSKVLPLEVNPSEVNPKKEELYRATRNFPEPILGNSENSALPENSISEPTQEIEESCAAPPEIYAIAQIPPIRKTRRVGGKSRITSEELLPFKEIWNREAPSSGVRVEELDDDEEKALRRLIKKHGDRTMEIFQAGLAYARTDDWWMKPERPLSMCNFLTNGKPEDYAKKYQHKVNLGIANPISETPMGEPADRPMSATEKKMMDDYLRFKALLSKKHEEKAA